MLMLTFCEMVYMEVFVFEKIVLFKSCGLTRKLLQVARLDFLRYSFYFSLCYVSFSGLC